MSSLSNFDFNVIGLMLLFGGLIFFGVIELIIPYREASVSKLKRWLINMGLGLINISVLNLIFVSLTIGVAVYVSDRQIGLLNLVEMPYWLKVVDTIILMDLILYFWHVLTHRVPLLWRFHRVHHTDLNMDVSTAVRFHLVEVILLAFLRLGVAYFIGADYLGVFLFECIYMAADQFEHSCLKVPKRFESAFWVLFVPPAMHRIHHSVALEERHSNFGTLFSIWDRLFGTLLTGVNQNQIWLGVDGHIQEKKLEIYHLYYMPFTPIVP